MSESMSSNRIANELQPSADTCKQRGGRREEGEGVYTKCTSSTDYAQLYRYHGGHSTTHVYLYDRCVGIQWHRHGLHIPCTTVKTYNCALALGSLVSIYRFEYRQIYTNSNVPRSPRLLVATARSSHYTRIAIVPSVRYFTLYS